MGIFGKLKNALEKCGLLQPRSAEAYDMLTDENGVSYKAKRLVEELRRRTQTPALILKPLPNSRPGIADSKLGGVPYWESGREYPTDTDGNPMMLLAQINFSQGPECYPLPGFGLLQFFIANDGDYGWDYDVRDVQSNFRVVRYETIDPSVTEEQVLAMNIPICGREEELNSPVLRELKLELSAGAMHMSCYDYRYGKEYDKVLHELFCKTEEDENYFGNLPKADKDYIFDYDDINNGCHMLGYPSFSQEDPRYDHESGEYYDTLLLQIDEFCHEGKEYVAWGDCGVGNFFINSQALEKEDFSRVLYNWDCC